MAKQTRTKKIIRRPQKPLVVIAIENHMTMIDGILEKAREFDWQVQDLSLTRFSIPTNPPPSGALVSYLPDHPMVQKLVQMSCPTIRLGQLPHPHDMIVPAVMPNLVSTGRLAAEHLAERNFKHLAYIGHEPWRECLPRFQEFRRRGEALGCSVHLLQLPDIKEPVPGDMASKYEKLVGLIGDWLMRLPRPLGVLGYHDRMASNICAAAMGVGLAVPEDVAVIGNRNDRYVCELSTIPLSSVDVNLEGCGRQAAVLLRQMMDGDTVPPVNFIAPRGVVRRHSTDVLAVDNPLVAQAMRFMWQHLDQPINVSEVAKELEVSRSTLDRAFRVSLGRGANAELHRKRLEYCCTLLGSTRLPVSMILKQVGFSSKSYLHRVFRNAHGMTPVEYRKSQTRNSLEN